ncbi:hypothetical protein BS47DRAFT_1357196 [Hydnum rufescens UP504]|uniref:Uncharacterized protein n=1 Tax=Hydnum rufescens UP504 TaxID=1448309 RepID=A0A9P6BB65_9AGAM|nr:hypothetical protein BS47DRAFT_1357196 [Hydnum rufescens UP504]
MHGMNQWSEDEKKASLHFLLEDFANFRENQNLNYMKAWFHPKSSKSEKQIKSMFQDAYHLLKYIHCQESHMGGGDGDILKYKATMKGIDVKSEPEFSMNVVNAFHKAGYYDMFEILCAGQPEVNKLVDLDSTHSKDEDPDDNAPKTT